MKFPGHCGLLNDNTQEVFIHGISIELNGIDRIVGSIKGSGVDDACFSYDEDYIHQSDSIGVSASLPLRAEPFSPEQTKNYFDGLLPEGYTRKTVAKWLHQEEDNYLRILAALGRECLGAFPYKCMEKARSIWYDIFH